MTNELLLHELLHGVVAIPFGLFLWYKTKSIKLAALVIATTYLVDLDHLVDYFMFYGFRFNLSDFLRADYFQITQRGIIPFHAWEWLIILGFMVRKKGWNTSFAVVFLGLLPHYLLDFIHINSFWFYSIVARGLNNFYFFN